MTDRLQMRVCEEGEAFGRKEILLYVSNQVSNSHNQDLKIEEWLIREGNLRNRGIMTFMIKFEFWEELVLV